MGIWQLVVRKGSPDKGHLLDGGVLALCGRPGPWQEPVRKPKSRCADCELAQKVQSNVRRR